MSHPYAAETEHPSWCVLDRCTVLAQPPHEFTRPEHRGTPLTIKVDRVQASVWLCQQPGQPITVAVSLYWSDAVAVTGDLHLYASAQLGQALSLLAVQGAEDGG